jgi:hypothetical protein
MLGKNSFNMFREYPRVIGKYYNQHGANTIQQIGKVAQVSKKVYDAAEKFTK